MCYYVKLGRCLETCYTTWSVRGKFETCLKTEYGRERWVT